MVFRFDNALRKFPRNPALLDVAGNAQPAFGKSEDALSIFKALIPALHADMAPDLAADHTGPARPCLAQFGPDNPQWPAVDEAMQVVGRARAPVGQKPKNPVLQNDLARALARQGRRQEVLSYARSAAAPASETVEAVGTLESTCNKAADPPDFGYHYVQALAAADQNGEALSVLGRVKDWDAIFAERNQAQSLLRYLGG